MKSERRHELQHNALADWLTKVVVVIKPYQNMISISVAVVLVAMLGYTWWSRQLSDQTTQAWDEMNAVIESGNMPKLATVIEGYPDTNVAQMAAVVLADSYLAQGCNRLFVNKATAQDELGKAIKLYESVREECRLPMLVERATFGLARAKEAKGDLPSAERFYEEVVTKWPKGAFGAAASQRAIDLKRPAIQRWYDDRFAHFDPKPVFFNEPGELPIFDFDSLPSEGPSSPIDTTFDLNLGDKDKGK